MKEIRTSIKFNNISIVAETDISIMIPSTSDLYNKDLMLLLKDDKEYEYNRCVYSKQVKIRYILPNLPNNIYYLHVLVKDAKSNVFWSYFNKNGIPIEVRGGTVIIKESQILLSNSLKYAAITSKLNSDQISIVNSECTVEIKTLALQITKNTCFLYLKVLSIHDWVASNIFYDMDALNSGQYKYNDSSAIATLKARRGVCQGISNLTVALLRSIGIVAYGLSCYALGISTTGGWDTVENMKALPNHQMTIAYVDNRWMIMDVTWDSDNIYINGKYTQKSGCGVSHKYFDNTIPFLSYTHRLMTNN